jgi:hypothetical protein
MTLNSIPKPKIENAWQVWQLLPIVISIHFSFPALFSLSFAEVLKEAAIPAIVPFSTHKQAENSMTGCCNNLPWTCHIAHLCG